MPTICFKVEDLCLHIGVFQGFPAKVVLGEDGIRGFAGLRCHALNRVWPVNRLLCSCNICYSVTPHDCELSFFTISAIAQDKL